MRVNSCIGPERDFDTTGEGVRDVPARCRHHSFSLNQQEVGNAILSCVLQKPVSQIERRHQVRAMLFHFSDGGIINVRTMFDRIHTSLRRPQNPLRSMRMRCYFAAKAVRLRDNGLHFFQRVLRGLRIISFGEHAASSTNFD